jgi:hypothetical protein
MHRRATTPHAAKNLHSLAFSLFSTRSASRSLYALEFSTIYQI